MSRHFNSIFRAALAIGVALAAFSPAASAKSNAPKKQKSPEQVLFAFANGTDGYKPSTNLIADASGNLYGTTEFGGDESCKTVRRGPKGCGVVFKLTPGGSESVLHAFSDISGDGTIPNEFLASDSSGNLYGMTEGGGAHGYGAIFEVTPGGVETVLYSFPSFYGDPFTEGLVVDAQGDVYGATSAGGGTGCGGAGCGTIFELTPGGVFTVLYAFTGEPDGQFPSGPLALDSSGDIYGVTQLGGTAGDGTVFEVAAGGGESTLYSFQGNGDGNSPRSGVIFDAQGNMYGTTWAGGTGGYGTVFELAPGGAETVLYSFLNMPDGAGPAGPLVLDASGNLYGATYDGGAYQFYGTVFKLAPGGAETILWSFGANTKYGAYPDGGLVMDQSGNIYGVTDGGGRGQGVGDGTVFKLTP